MIADMALLLLGLLLRDAAWAAVRAPARGRGMTVFGAALYLASSLFFAFLLVQV